VLAWAWYVGQVRRRGRRQVVRDPYGALDAAQLARLAEMNREVAAAFGWTEEAARRAVDSLRDFRPWLERLGELAR
jgi:hypothetical protein